VLTAQPGISMKIWLINGTGKFGGMTNCTSFSEVEKTMYEQAGYKVELIFRIVKAPNQNWFMSKLKPSPANMNPARS